MLAALVNPKRGIEKIITTKAQHAEVLTHLKPLGGRGQRLAEKTQIVETSAFANILPEDAVHQGVAALVQPLSQPALHEVEGARIVLLDQVTDPHNIGAILRSAAAFGAAAVVVTKDHSAPESGVMAKSASGTLELIPLVTVVNLSQAMAELKQRQYWCIGLDARGEKALHQVPSFAKVALVMGAEGKGLRHLTADQCDLLVRLPMAEGVESLNVSNATAVALYELMRQTIAG